MGHIESYKLHWAEIKIYEGILDSFCHNNNRTSQRFTIVPAYPWFHFSKFQLLTVNHGPKNIKLKILEINNSYILNSMLFGVA